MIKVKSNTLKPRKFQSNAPDESVNVYAFFRALDVRP